MTFKVNGYIFRGGDSGIFILASHFSKCHFLKGGTCICWSKFFDERLDPFWQCYLVQGTKLEVKKVISL